VPTAAALLAEAAYLRAQDEEAEALARVSEELASASDIESQYRWRGVRAKVLARAGRAEEALAVAERALALVLATDGPTLQADVYSTLAEVRAAAGDLEESEVALGRAAELYALKGDVVSAARVSARRSALISSRTA
jgi:tetratricopeptide (TPR) repeat protein